LNQHVSAQRFLESTRGRVVGLLRCRSLTVDDLALALGLTDNAVRAHLTALERDGFVRSAGVRRGSGAGKPATLYELAPGAEAIFSRAYPAVLKAVLEELVTQLRTDGAETFLRTVGLRLAQPLRPAEGTPHRERLLAAVEVLNALGGAATLDEDGPTAVIRGCGCPLGAAVADRPETCRAVESLLTEIVGSPLRQCCRQGDRPSCCFEVAGAVSDRERSSQS
jgi:predicted ArsR family transcriptional regulator